MMKRFLALLAVIAPLYLFAAGVSTFDTPVVVTNSSTTVPVQLSTASATDFGTNCTAVLFLAYKSARTANTGTIWIQTTSANDGYGIPIGPTGSLSLTAPAGKFFTPQQFYLDVESPNDGVIAIFLK